MLNNLLTRQFNYSPLLFSIFFYFSVMANKCIDNEAFEEEEEEIDKVPDSIQTPSEIKRNPAVGGRSRRGESQTHRSQPLIRKVPAKFKPLRQMTREVLPRLDHYRNAKSIIRRNPSAGQRPTLDDLQQPRQNKQAVGV